MTDKEVEHHFRAFVALKDAARRLAPFTELREPGNASRSLSQYLEAEASAQHNNVCHAATEAQMDVFGTVEFGTILKALP